MAFDLDATDFQGKQFYIGPSAVVGITLIAGQDMVLLQWQAGGSIQIGGASLLWGQGFALTQLGVPLPAVRARGTFYAVAQGNTATLAVFRGTSGDGQGG